MAGDEDTEEHIRPESQSEDLGFYGGSDQMRAAGDRLSNPQHAGLRGWGDGKQEYPREISAVLQTGDGGQARGGMERSILDESKCAESRWSRVQIPAHPHSCACQMPAVSLSFTNRKMGSFPFGHRANSSNCYPWTQPAATSPGHPTGPH